MPARTARRAAARAFASQPGLQATGTSTDRVNGLAAATVQFLAQTEQAVLAGYAAFVELDGTTYRILAYTSRDRSRAYDAAFRRTIGSFQRVTDPEVLGVKPQRIRLVDLRERMTLAEFQQRYPSVVPIEQLALINGAASPSASFGVGTTLKRVVVQ